MSKSLIITEKPSVATDIAKALGGFKKGKDYYDNEKYVISWAVGHLFELAVPVSMKEQDKWDMKKLPIMPPAFELGTAGNMTLPPGLSKLPVSTYNWAIARAI